MIEERGGWFVRNVRDARWFRKPTFGRYAIFEEEDARFPETGVHVAVLEPGRPACLYHRENAQEDFLVLSGCCLLLVNGERRELGQWDFVHCPAGVTHVFVGAGDGPCAILMIGHRPPREQHELWYPKSERAAALDAETPVETSDPGVAYAERGPAEPDDPPDWPLR